MPQPEYSETERKPVRLTTIEQSDGRITQYPPPERWDDWVEWESKSWPKRVARNYTLVPTICFNCESACGLLAYVDKDTYDIRKFEGNPMHPGSRGRNCAKGPATHNQTYDPERILYPLKRVGERGAGKWKRVSWDEALTDIALKMRASRNERRDGIMYHVGRPGEDHFANRTIQSWGVDGHNSHTNICSASARVGYYMWSGADRPSPDYAHARATVLVSAHLESGHYFNPHAQRIIEGKNKGAKLIVLDPRLSNTAARADVWLPTWPGSEATVLLSIANFLIQNRSYDRDFVRRWVNWEATLEAAAGFAKDDDVEAIANEARAHAEANGAYRFEDFERLLSALYDEFTFERAAEESQVPIERLLAAAEAIGAAGDRLSGHTWRSATMGNRGGWQVARALFFLSVLTGSVSTKGGTGLNSNNKFVPKSISTPDPLEVWNELHLPHEWPFAMYEMSFLLPHFLEEGRGDIDVYFTRVYNPMWINPDGFMWMKALRDESKIKCHVALTPTWNESAWFADYVLPMGHAGERHDVMSQETHAGQWIGFRQPVRRVAMERAGIDVNRTHEANPGEVWEESELFIDLSWKMDPDGSLGIRKHFESPTRPGEPITMDEYWGHIFEHSVPGLKERAESEGLTPLAFMRKFGAFEISRDVYVPHENERHGDGGVEIDGVRRDGFATPSHKLELFSPTLSEWGWKEQEYVIPWTLESHVARRNIDSGAGEMLLLPTFRLPTLIHTRSANAKWLYEISHKNPIWMHPQDAERIGVETGEIVRVTTEIGYFVDRVWITEGIKPGIIAMSHHLGRWRLKEAVGIGAGMSNLVTLDEKDGEHELHIVHGARAWKSPDPDTSRVWWEDVGVHQNLTHAVHPDPVSGAHCWHQKALNVEKARPGDQHGDVSVDTKRSMAVYRAWLALTRSAVDHSPDGTRRPDWLKRPLKPVRAAYALPAHPWGRD
jgi:anaerobic selenocysteine-containing dehydrogenase